MIFNSIRWQLQSWHGLILLAVLTGFGLTAYHVARGNQMRRLDLELEQRLAMLFRPMPPEKPMDIRLSTPADEDLGPREGQGPGRFGGKRGWRRGEDFTFFRDRIRESIPRVMLLDQSQTNGMYAVFWDANGSVLAQTQETSAELKIPENTGASDLAAFREFERGPGHPPGPGPGPMPPTVFRTRAGMREVYRFLPMGECVLVGRSMAPEAAAMRRLALSLASAGAGVLALGLAGGWWLASRAIKPIDAISATALKISGGDLSQRIDAAHMQNELGRLASVLNSTFARLEAAFANQARFTSDASHELRTPLAVILSQIQTALSRERSVADYRGSLEACQRAAQRMRQLIDSLLALARLDAGQEAMSREKLDLARLAEGSADLLGPLAADREVQLQKELHAVEVIGDPDGLGQVATNLLSNAIEFNRAGGQVTISTRLEQGSALLAVSDTGEGIPAEDLPHIFERFYRVDKSRSRVKGHAGLGLAICKAIVEAHSGTIEVTSEPGKGSRFVVKLPLPEPQQRGEKPIPVETAAGA